MADLAEGAGRRRADPLGRRLRGLERPRADPAAAYGFADRGLGFLTGRDRLDDLEHRRDDVREAEEVGATDQAETENVGTTGFRHGDRAYGREERPARLPRLGTSGDTSSLGVASMS